MPDHAHEPLDGVKAFMPRDGPGERYAVKANFSATASSERGYIWRCPPPLREKD